MSRPEQHPTIEAEAVASIPAWATLQGALRSKLVASATEFVNRYTRDDGTLIWRDAWGGMDGSDDPYEAFMYLALLYAIDGDDGVYALARRMWDAITWQWTQYGQIDREFDRYYDWMHHGEANLYHYFMGFTKPDSVADRQRAERFARMYTGEDPLAPNFDPNLKIIRAPHTGSAGPRFAISAEDYSTHRAVLADYPPPFEDLETVPSASPTCNWLDDRVYAEVLEKMNERTQRGDVPLNLNATSLITHAFMYSGSPALRKWVIDYVAGWHQRATANGGILPDNVGLSGVVGEYLGGAWWGGHYGWRWPHGLLTVVEPALNASLNAYLLTGDPANLGLIREQLDANFALGHDEDGTWVTPHKHQDAGWTDYRPASPFHSIHLWANTFADEDWARVERTPPQEAERVVRVPRLPFAHKHYNVNTIAWYEYMSGRYPEFPELALRANLELVDQQLGRMRSSEGDPERWPLLDRLAGRNDGPSLQVDGYAIHAWQEFCPVYFESLVQLMWGAPMHISHGGLQFGTFRYFDAATQGPGLPRDAAALVSSVHATGATVTLCNTNETQARSVVVQGGSFREHRIVSVTAGYGSRRRTIPIDGPDMTVVLPPRSLITLEVALERHASVPSYETPWSRKKHWPSTITGRSA